jgi:RNA polymerase sigma-70 factor (ECF subfamily)
MSTAQLVGRCAPTCARLCTPAGLRAAFSAHAGDITGYGYRLLADRGLAEEVTQDVFVKAWRHCAGYDDSFGHLRFWLFAIARNAVVDAVRARDRRPRLAASERHDRADPTDEFARLDTAHVLGQTLPRIAPYHRGALTSVYLHGHTYEHAARTLGVPVGTVKSRVHNGLRALRAMLAES